LSHKQFYTFEHDDTKILKSQYFASLPRKHTNTDMTTTISVCQDNFFKNHST